MTATESTAAEATWPGPTVAVATTPERVRRLRAAAAAAAGGESLLLCVELTRTTPAAAAATAQLTTLAAFTLAYATGRPVSTVLPVFDSAVDLDVARDLAALLGRLAGDRAVYRDDPIGQADRWLSRLSSNPRRDAAESAFLDRLTKAWAFAIACGGQPAAVARVLSADRFLVLPAATSAHPRVVRQGTSDGARYGLLTPGVLCHAGIGQPDSGWAGALVNPVILRLRPGMSPDELTLLCARLNPVRAPGRLVLLTRPTPDRRLAALLAATAGYQPVWVLAWGSGRRSGPRLRRMQGVLAANGAHLGGVWLPGNGRRLAQVVRLAAALSSQFTVRLSITE